MTTVQASKQEVEIGLSIDLSIGLRVFQADRTE